MAKKKKLKKKLYKPVIARKDYADEHFYYVDGKYFPSVTKILHEGMPTPFALKYWIGEVGNERANQKLEKAGARGTLIHNTCEELLRGKEVDLEYLFKNKSDKKCIVSFIDWVYQTQPKYNTKYIEFVVASDKGFAGTVDFFCYINGEPWIIDFKTSGGVYESHKLQLVAYRYAFEQMTGIHANMGILHLNYRLKRGWSFVEKMEIKKKPLIIEDYMTVLEMYKLVNGGVIPEPKEVDVYPNKVRLFDSNGEVNGKKSKKSPKKVKQNRKKNA